MVEESSTATILGRLEELRAALGAAGFAVRVDRPRTQPPCLRVASPQTAQLHEEVGCRPRVDDEVLWFFWSWGEPICPAVDVERAAKEIGHVLGPRQ